MGSASNNGQTVRNETFAWTSLRPNGSSSPSFPLSVSRHKSFTALLLPSSASSSFPPLPFGSPSISLSSLFANRSDREATQSYIFPAGAPSVLPSFPPSSFRRSVRPRPREGGRPSCLWREMGRRSYCGGSAAARGRTESERREKQVGNFFVDPRRGYGPVFFQIFSHNPS